MKSNILQDFMEPTSNGFSKKQTKPSYNIELSVGTVFNEICQVLEEHGIAFNFETQPLKVMDKLNGVKSIVEFLCGGFGEGSQDRKEEHDDSNVISCRDCQVYEANLQKLQNEVRQHIRLEQQMKIFQDNMEQKIEEMKKERKDQKDAEKKMEGLRKAYEELKVSSANNTKKAEMENQYLKGQLKQSKRNHVNSSQNQPPTSRREHRQYQKQNCYRNMHTKRDEKDKTHNHNDRKSVDKRPQSCQKWRLSHQKSNKVISTMNQKIIQEKSRQEKRRIIQSKFQFRK